jgi:hypothetical protein
VQFCRTAVPDTVRSISVRKPFIYISTVSKSFMSYTFYDNDGYVDIGAAESNAHALPAIEKFFADTQARPTTTHVVVPIINNGQTSSPGLPQSSMTPKETQVVIVTDLTGGVTVLAHPTEPPERGVHRISRVPIVHGTLPHFISRLSQPFTPPLFLQPSSTYRRPLTHNGTLLHPDAVQSHVVARPILASSPSGSLTLIKLVDRDAALLLKFLLNLSNHHGRGQAVVKGLVSPSRVIVTPLNPLFASTTQQQNWPDDMLLNGNILSQFCGSDGKKRLHAMLEARTWEEEMGPEESERADRVGNDVKGRVDLFLELLEAVLGEKQDLQTESNLNTDDTMEDKDFDGSDVDMKDLEDVSEISGRKVKMAIERCCIWLEGMLADVF